MTLLFQELIRQPTEEWTRDRLELLPGKELAALCEAMGFPISGTKQQRIDRLIDLCDLYRTVRPYWGTLDVDVPFEHVQALANAYKATELLAMCRRAGCFLGSNKFQRAGALIGWARGCARKGMEAYNTAKQYARSRPTRQLSLLEAR